MPPEILTLIASLVEMAIKDYPAIKADLADILSKPNPTPQDWLDFKAKYGSATFEQLAPHAAANLPAKIVTPASTPELTPAAATVTDANPPVPQDGPAPAEIVVPVAPAVHPIYGTPMP